MRSSLALAIVVVLGLLRPALADIAEVVVGEPTGAGRATAGKLIAARDRTTARVAIVVESRSTEPSVVAVPVLLPPHARVIAMAVTLGDRVLVSERDEAGIARQRHELAAEAARPGALLEYAGPGRALSLRVGPLSTKARAIVELTLALPAAEDLGWMGPDPVDRRAVTPELSLFAQPAQPALSAMPTVVVGQVLFCGGPHAAGSLDKTIVRRYVKRYLPRLRACYERALWREPQLDGAAALHFTIAADGRTTDISVDGTLASPATLECIADDVSHWEFPAVLQPAGELRVNYPVTFTRGR